MGERDRERELFYLDDTEPLDHSDDALETQPVNLYGETQVMNLDGETQVLEYPDCIDNLDTQLLDEFDNQVALDSDDEGSDKTQILSYNDDDDDGLTRWNNGQSDCPCLDKPNEEGETEQAHISIHEQPDSGPQRMDFTSIRAESLRASGLAAQNMALKHTNNEFLSGKHAIENKGLSCCRGSPEFEKEVIQEHDKGNYNENGMGFSSEGKSRISGSSAVRKLFVDEEKKEFQPNSNMVDEGEVFIHLPTYNGDVSGLSYVDSQEPGDLSQINALDFVDKFINTNTLEFDQDIDRGKSTGGKLKPLSSAKGPQSLAKLAKDMLKVREKGAFDWDDTYEDEGGGDIFCRKKEEFFDSRSRGRSFAWTQKPKSRTVNKRRDRLVHSDSRLMKHGANGIKKGAQKAQLNLRRDLANEFDEQLNMSVSKGQLETIVANTNVPEIPDIGFDTQMAAEAMEALCHVEDHGNHHVNDACQGYHMNSKVSPDDLRDNNENGVCLKQLSSRTRECPSNIGVVTRQSKKRFGAEFCEEALISSGKRSKNVRKQADIVRVTKSSKHAQSNRSGKLKKVPSKDSAPQNARVLEKSYCGGIDGTVLLSGVGLTKKRDLQGKGITPVAKRTRHSLASAQSMSSDCGEEGDMFKIDAHKEKRVNNSGIGVSSLSKAKQKYSLSGRNQSGGHENVSPTDQEQSNPRFSNGISLGALSYPKGRRSRRNIRGQVKKFSLSDESNPSARQGDTGQSINGRKKSECYSRISVDFGTKRKTRSSSYPDVSQDNNLVGTVAVKHSEKKGDTDSLPPQENAETTARLYASPVEKSRPPDSASVTPTSCKTPVHDASPVCMGNEYYRQLCKRNPSRPYLTREITSLSSTCSERTPVSKDLRKRRDMADVRVLYSHHLDDDIIKQQKKILARFGVSVASSVSDATHFIADKFVRTRNMLEAIASGKPVVTHLWIESCGQANCFIDEKSYILRDAKKEREFGFSMPVSLARASQCPLLQGRRVLITPNTKPCKEIISSLVRAVDGKAVERIGRTTTKGDRVPDDLLVLSCEEDQAICLPFLEKGAAVYSSELLLNGIVTQRLDFERHRLFADHVKKTRSTIWLRKDGDEFRRVSKTKC